jgi:hypothetical protein
MASNILMMLDRRRRRQFLERKAARIAEVAGESGSLEQLDKDKPCALGATI